MKSFRLVNLGGRFGVAFAAFLAAFSALLTFGYNPLQDPVGGLPVPPRWPGNTLTWSLNPNLVGSMVDTSSGVTVATAVTNAAMTWQNTKLSGQALTVVQLIRGTDSSLPNPDPTNASDCLNVVSFSPTVNFPTGVIAFAAVASVAATTPPPFNYTCKNADGTTTTKTCSLPACIIDVDMEFNPKEAFSTSTTPLANHFDVQAVATHEFGHALGLDHSGIAHTVMYPFGDTRASIPQRDLAVDDIVGVAFLYPAPPLCTSGTASFNCSLGVIAGRITLNANGIYGAHVVAIDAASGAAVVDGLSNPDGTYRLVGVPPGTYNVLALPLGPDANTGVYSIDNFSGWTCGYAPNAPPCCDPAKDATCTGTRLADPTDYTGKFF